MGTKEKQPIIYDIGLYGPPGSGKTALAGAILDGFPNGNGHGKPAILSSGALCRKAAEQDTPTGKIIAECIVKGDLVPNSYVIPMVMDEYARLLKESNIIIWDGYFRDREQFRHFYYLTHNHILGKIKLEVDKETIMERVLGAGEVGRRQCPNCNRETSGLEGACPACGTILAQRTDDNPAVWLKRYDFYYSDIAPVVKDFFADFCLVYKRAEDTAGIITQLDDYKPKPSFYRI